MEVLDLVVYLDTGGIDPLRFVENGERRPGSIVYLDTGGVDPLHVVEDVGRRPGLG